MSLPSVNFLHHTVSRYSPDKMLKIKGNTARSKVTSKPHHDVTHLRPLSDVPATYQLPTQYGVSRYSPDKNRKVQVTMGWLKIKSRSHNDFAYLHHLTNVPTKYQPSIPYSCCKIVHTRQPKRCSVDSRNFKKWGRSPTTTQNVGEGLKILGDDFMISLN